MKILSDKRFKNLIKDLRNKAMEIEKHRSTLRAIGNHLYFKLGHRSSENYVYLINEIEMKGYSRGIKEGSGSRDFIEDFYERKIKELEKNEQELIKQNNELREYIRNNT